MDELNNLRSVLRALVVSSSVQMDVMMLLRDYRLQMGSPIPLTKFGYRDPVLFLKERFNDCFLMQGPAANPTVTLIVTDEIKHIDTMVRKQKSSTLKGKSKRRSVEASVLAQRDMIVNTFNNSARGSGARGNGEKYRQEKRSAGRPAKPVSEPKKDISLDKKKPLIESDESLDKENKGCGNGVVPCNVTYYSRRVPLHRAAELATPGHKQIEDNSCNDSVSQSGHLSSSTNSSAKMQQLEELKSEITDLVLDHPEGVLCTNLIRLYRERFGREMDFSRFGYTSVLSVSCALEGDALRLERTRDSTDWRLVDARAPPPADPAPVRARAATRARARAAHDDGEDALPGIDFDPEVFPADCMSFAEVIPPLSLDGLSAGDMLEVIVGEVYSPSHFWLLRLGDEYYGAMNTVMDEMTKHYRAAGDAAALLAGAVRVGHYCSSQYERDWHRALIVSVVDCDTVKVRHIDYGTVERVQVTELRALRREWGALPAQAVRARLAGARPPAPVYTWPRPAAAHFLHLVRNRPLVANVVSVDSEDNILEVVLIDTSTDEDTLIHEELVEAGHADPHYESTTHTSEWFLYPRFKALETAATPNYAELHAYQRDGIVLRHLPEYTRHVPVDDALDLPLLAAPAPPPPEFESEPEPEQSFDSSPPPPPSLSPSPVPAPVLGSLIPLTFPQSSGSPHPHSLSSFPLSPQHSPPMFSAFPAPLPFVPSGSGPLWFPGPMRPPPGYAARPSPPRLPAKPPLPSSDVTLSQNECEMFCALGLVDPSLAHQFMVDAFQRRLNTSSTSALNPLATPFMLPPQQQLH